jgi:L-serine dehydratase
MKSIREIFVYGPGPSSSHTIGPYRIGQDFRKKIEGLNVEHIDIVLYQSLAFTGKGHLTDQILKTALEGYQVNIFFDISTQTKHPNTLKITAYLSDGSKKEDTYVSYGGGVIGLEGQPISAPELYPFSTFEEMKEYMEKNKIEDIYTLIESFEGKDILSFGLDRISKMFEVVEKGLNSQGLLPGRLKLKRVAKELNLDASSLTHQFERKTLLLSSYAYAVSEENASGDFIVTSPTCGSSGVVPSVLYYEYKQNKMPLERIAKSLLVGGMIADFIKTNASISGACDGCQAEVGTASSMAAASLCYLYGLSLHQIEYGAEVAMEHFLGLTCDPVQGYVQIPCIERNAMASIHAYSAFLFAEEISKLRHNEVSFDDVVKAMKATGDDLPYQYKETSLGGLAEIVKKKDDGEE